MRDDHGWFILKKIKGTIMQCMWKWNKSVNQTTRIGKGGGLSSLALRHFRQ